MSTPWFLRRRWRVFAAVALLLDLTVGVFAASMAFTAHSAATSTGADRTAASSSADSSVSVAWTDQRSSYDPDWTSAANPDAQDPNQKLFTDLQVTVAQTRGLTDQGLKVSWTGGKATPNGGGQDYLQIMQCWASKGQEPTPQQCQWGTPNSALSGLVGPAAASRNLMTGSDADPKQALGPNYTHAPFGQRPQNLVPFWSVTDPHQQKLGWANDPNMQPPFNAAQSNEVTFARTAADGSGQYIVNLQSALSSPYLGCGDPKHTSAGKTCWLVVVPRGEYNVNGADATAAYQAGDTTSPYVNGSPLSALVWQNRIQVPLNFAPTGSSCNLNSAGTATAGTELIQSAFASWQPAICKKDGSGPLFTFSTTGDGLGRTAVTAGSPAMDFVASPVAATATNGATLVYAPVATSSLVFSYLIDKNYSSDATPAQQASNGSLVTTLRLDPRLVAKMLTQSYRNDTPGDGKGSGATVPAANPDSIIHDPEFLELNPEFKGFFPGAAPEGLMVPFGNSDAASALWTWLRGDTAARNFLAGKRDPWGMRINAAYADLDLATATLDSFAKADPSQFQTGDAPAPGYGTLDMLPYTANFTDGAARTVVANAGTRTFWDNTRVPPQYVAKGSQQPGSRFEIAVTTSQAAALYGLPVATLADDPNDTSGAVPPTAAAMLKELAKASVPTDVDGVATIDPAKPVAGGYPLAMRTYAVINVCASTSAQLEQYAGFLDYAAGKGQVLGNDLGQLPPGYAPLSPADRTQTGNAAKTLRSEAADPKCTHPTTSPSPSASASASATATTTSTTGTGTTGTGTGSTGIDGSTPPGTTPTGDGSTVPGATPPADAAPGQITPAAYISSAARFSLLAALCLAVPFMVVGPTLVAAARKKQHN